MTRDLLSPVANLEYFPGSKIVRPGTLPRCQGQQRRQGFWGHQHQRMNNEELRQKGAPVDKPTPERHTPVLLDRCLELLAPGVEAAREAGRTPVVLDATLGMGGHSEGILGAFPDAILVAVDRDTQAIDLAGKRLAKYGDRVRLVHAVYDEIPEIMDRASVTGIDAQLYDLGVSSLQLDEADRGFAYAYDAPLDMRMDGGDHGDQLTAADILNTYSQADLIRILREWGEERYAAKVARAVVTDRATTPWTRSGPFVEMLQRVIPKSKHGGHPAKRTFQALRIEVNQELEVLARAIPAGLGALNVGGVQVVESYHSLEDRIVKRAHVLGLTIQAPPDLPVVPDYLQPWLRPLTRGAEVAPEDEVERNPRSASVKLRAVQTIREKP